ncbi:hypothetical protein Leryth_026332 [Lithospermum erythrorhizon]|nr:hypothetical protein Leryth_026332 [Lithospermum erythrorhizon]
MAVDARQILSAVLTVTMFVMLGNMIKRDHFDSILVTIHETSYVESASEQSIVSSSREGNDLWRDDVSSLKQCWDKPVLEESDQSEGFVTFSLTNGPEYHASQIADAVVVARYLRATLVLPDIRGTQPGDRINFKDVYDIEKLEQSLDGVVRVARSLPAKISSRNLAVVKVPSQVIEDYLAENVEPVFRSKGNIRLVTYFPSVNMKRTETKNNLDSVACLAMFGSLELKSEVYEVVDSMVERLKSFSRKTNGQFIAVDLRVDMLEKKGCQGNGASKSKSCYSPQGIALFLRKIGFGKDTTVYLTQSRWDDSLDSLKDFFPKTYTKESIMPADRKAKFLNSQASEYEKVIDFYICSQSDVFVPAISGLFYANVAGKRIASGKTQILVPAYIPDSSVSSADFLSHYVTKKNHFAYSCYC